MCPATAISSIRNDADIHLASTAACERNLGDVCMLPVILCSLVGNLFEPVSKPLADAPISRVVIGCVRRMGASTMVVALSIRRVIRANFPNRVGILAGERPATVPAVDRPDARKSNEPMRLIDVSTYVPARL